MEEMEEWRVGLAARARGMVVSGVWSCGGEEMFREEK